MSCPYFGRCGGCLWRGEDPAAYQARKLKMLEGALQNIQQSPVRQGFPRFIPDSTRRRASLAFQNRRGQLTLGFNQSGSHQLLDIENCFLLTPELNQILPGLRRLLSELCALPLHRRRGKKTETSYLSDGDVWLTQAANGIDIVLEFDAPLGLEQRMLLCDYANGESKVIRISHRAKTESSSEPVVEKAPPYIIIAGTEVYLPAGTFLQPSALGEQTLIELVKNYLGSLRGRIADLFCGVGTFSYALASDPANSVLAVDSSAALLQGFRESVNRNRLTNIELMTRNLFKYPLDAAELKGVEAVVFDPPRAGAAAQTAALAALPEAQKPQKIIAVSCNPGTFANDANRLLAGGYFLNEVTLVDQFIYSNHSELVALFTKT